MVPLSGAFAQIGQQVSGGAQIAADQINAQGGVNGQKIVFVKEDEQLSPTKAAQDMRALASSGVSLVIGGTTTPDCEAALPIAEQYHMTIISATCADTVLTEAKFNPYFFEIAPRTDELAIAASRFVHDQFPDIQTWNNISFDYVTGHSYWDEFVKSLKGLNPAASFGKSIFFPIQATQLTPYVTSMVSSVPASAAAKQGLFLSTYAAGTIGLAQQGRSYNLFSSFKAVIDVSGNELISAALGGTGPRIYYVYDYYSTAYNNTMNTAFVNAYRKNNPTPPGSFEYQGYTAVQAFAAAIKKAGSTKGEAISKALVGLKFNAPKGVVYFRSDHMLVAPVTVFECQGQAQAPGGFSCSFAKPIQPAGIQPPPSH